MILRRSIPIVAFRAILVALLAVGQSAAAESGDAPSKSWNAPPFWMSSATESHGRRALAAGPVALPFIALPPCRLVDTRGNGAPLTGGFLPAATVRNYTLTGVCGVPANAQAISLNATAVKPTGPGFLVLYPEGGTFPPVSTLNYLGGDVIVNAAVVPLSGTGGIAVALGVSGGDVLLDTNGYYAVADVASLSGLVGDVTLAAGANVTITPSLNTLTIAATGGPGGSLPVGTQFQTLYNTGGGWAASSVLLNNGTNLAMNGTLALPDPLLITSGGQPFLSSGTTSSNNTFLGGSAGAAVTASVSSTAVGHNALATATLGDRDVAIGAAAMANGPGIALGGKNVAVGFSAYSSGPSGSFNTAIGPSALGNLTSGDNNTALGHWGLLNLTSGFSNTALGNGAGMSLTSGSGNLYLANSGAATESNVMRIGGTQTTAFIAGVRGVTTGSATGIPVLIDSNGQLGTVSSSASVKDDIRDMAGESAKLMQLRPVTFRYKAHGPDGPKQYGLIAEEVNEVLPELVARSKDGKIETVMYHELPALLLNEIQRLEKRIADLERQIAASSVRPER